MNFYKKLIPNKKIRFKILSCLRFIPDKPMLKLQYRFKCGRKLNLSNPMRYMEKLQWLKLYYRDPLMQQCADKYQVRAYVENKGLGHILNDLYAVFETPEDICLDKLPEQFVLKLSNGSSTNLLCKNKEELELTQVQKNFCDFYAQSDSAAGREWVYRGGKPVIIAEKFLKDPIHPDGSLRDYKILCFGGKPEYIICVDGRHTEHYCHVIYDVNWNKQKVVICGSSADADYPKPSTLPMMLKVAEKLSSDFPAVRVDLYSIEGKLYFGELTFFPWSGYMRFEPDEFDFTLGSRFILPKRNYYDSLK